MLTVLVTRRINQSVINDTFCGNWPAEENITKTKDLWQQNMIADKNVKEHGKWPNLTTGYEDEYLHDGATLGLT